MTLLKGYLCVAGICVVQFYLLVLKNHSFLKKWPGSKTSKTNVNVVLTKIILTISVIIQ